MRALIILAGKKLTSVGLVENGRGGRLDFFCSIRYYKDTGDKRVALKFDYYMLRAIFRKGEVEVRVFMSGGRVICLLKIWSGL
jgi:hypothetical protein